MNFIASIGSARRSQGVFTYGIGAIVDFSKGSFMPLGLYQMDNQWHAMPREDRESFTFYEPRLQKLLGVKAFRSLPTPGEGNLGNYGDRVKEAWAVPCVRFPLWLECPKCHRLGMVNDPFEQQPDGKVKCVACVFDVNPVRFVVACHKGHIEDFPWEKWAHRDSGHVCDNPLIYLKSKGKSAALGDLYLECKNCKPLPQGLAGIFNKAELAKLGVICWGNRPWLRVREQCGDGLTTLQRGGSNVYFPVIASMLSIPPSSEAMSKILEPYWDLINSIEIDQLEPILKGFLRTRNLDIDPAEAANWAKRRKGIEDNESSNDEQSARYQEFQSLISECLPVSTSTHKPEFENSPFEPEDKIKPWIDLFSAVHRLREVRALCGFTRIQPYSLNIENIADALLKKRISPLSARLESWRPAVEVRGEGLFLRLNEEKVTDWISDLRVTERANKINNIFVERCLQDGVEPPYKITPRHLLVHSLAHILIRRISLDCGYSSSSLRERLYISDGDETTPPMAALLIYTASPDSDGSLGGIVGLATAERMGNIICRAIYDAQWCGNDPVCIETDARTNGERLSSAACHNCLLIPETACEKFNRELDRGMLVGFLTSSGTENIPGFFSNFPSDD